MNWNKIYKKVFMIAESLPFGSELAIRHWNLVTKIGTHIFYTYSDKDYEEFKNDIVSCEECFGTGYEDGMTPNDYATWGKLKERIKCKQCGGTGDTLWYHNKSNKLPKSKLPF